MNYGCKLHEYIIKKDKGNRFPLGTHSDTFYNIDILVAFFVFTYYYFIILLFFCVNRCILLLLVLLMIIKLRTKKLKNYIFLHFLPLHFPFFISTNFLNTNNSFGPKFLKHVQYLRSVSIEISILKRSFILCSFGPSNILVQTW